ncbi:diaminopimelate epimerase [Pedobacter heparinus]|uniref:Diaminopimelate epimerase n=1 Tax=Pedobacter heparinus (strain ATCC 13125 / DSM 2366 / CIP 104194 / JCM 7457 / NBRC 12017 / NCIMB 9290 / NRRL B-14731 / HIM 762-3) TaxID=485917 RepID=C6XYG7_PEDHD|nr:diaminopimelate epimerase [Pedobacter heparinus]ACU02434.1 diaminopimelate epimerase [Pedobacter heparinus DSM 2366]
MNIHFFKYQGAGNDFILIDHSASPIKDIDYEWVKKICDRRFGVGGDGLMFLTSHPDYDFEMLYFNSDGRPGSMCGNGGRCIVAFAKHLGIIDKETNFLAVDGPHYAKISAEGNWVELQMIDIDTIGRDGEAYVLNTGSPHYVARMENLATYDVYHEGKAIRNNETYKKEGINVNFVEDKGDHLFVRTFERGVEDETYACGTGVTAVALSMALHKQQSGHLKTPVKVLGGDLSVEFDYNGRQFTNVFLCGPAEKVFEGELNW